MTDLRICLRKKNGKKSYVIQDYDDGRKQIKKDGKPLAFGYIKDAKVARDLLFTAVESKQIKLTGRHKFMDKFNEYGLFRIEMANKPGARDSVSGVAGYKSFHDKYAVPYFPKAKENGTDRDLYLDEVDGDTLVKFVQALKAAKVTHKTNVNIIAHIHTFLRWCMFKKYHHEFSSALSWKIGKHGSSYLLPDNDDELYEKETYVLTNEEANSVLAYVKRRRELSREDAIAYGFFSVLSCFGLRSSEIRGLKKTSFDFDNNIVSIKGAFHARTGYVNKTKNRGSRRPISFSPRQAVHLKWFADYMFKLKPHNKYFFCGARGNGPISEYYSRKLVWKTYEQVGLAKLEWYTQSNTRQVRVTDCKFKGEPTKTWRHFVALNMIDNMEHLKLTPNQIKQRVGHTRWTTTVDRYGNHNRPTTSKQDRIVAEKVDLALGLDFDDWSENTGPLDKDDLLINI